MTFDTPALRLVDLDKQEDITACHKNNYEEWGSELTLEQYLQREKVFRSQESTRDGGLTHWALQEQNQDTGEWEIVSSMESLKRPAFYKQKGKPVVDSVSHSIGAVFTPAQHRGKGYASKMLKMGVETLDDWQLGSEQKPYSFQALWSDVGDYYCKFGYESMDSHELLVQVDSSNSQFADWPEGVERIGMDEVDQLATQDEQQLKEMMERDTERDGVIRVAIKPQSAIHHTTFQREIYLSRYMSKHQEKGRPETYGAKCNGCWILWTHDFTGNKLATLRVFVPYSAHNVKPTIIKLVQAAIHETQQWNLSAFTLWVQDMPTHEQDAPGTEDLASFAESLPGVASAKFHKRPTSKSLPMARFHPNMSAGAKHWVYAGRYGWF